MKHSMNIMAVYYKNRFIRFLEEEWRRRPAVNSVSIQYYTSYVFFITISKGTDEI